jgi:hypothetical protein
MTPSISSPRLAKGAILSIDPITQQTRSIKLQYNPEEISRSLTPRIKGGGEAGGRSEVMRIEGAPQETITLKVIIDAVDQLNQGDPGAGQMGIYPQLSALELLVYPSTASVIASTALLALGTMEILPPVAPLTLFFWGPKRIVPVKLTSFTINETYHDANLNPISAEVSLSMQVLSYNDLPAKHPGFAIFLTHQIMKESMAALAKNMQNK